MGSWFYNIVEVMAFMIYNEELCIAFLVFIVISGNHPTKSSIRLFMGNHQNSKLPHFIFAVYISCTLSKLGLGCSLVQGKISSDGRVKVLMLIIKL